MRYFRTTQGTVAAFSEDDIANMQRDGTFPNDVIEMTQEETQRHLELMAVAPVPQTISRAQGRLVLYRAGLWAQVQDYVAGITDPAEQFEADTALNHTTDWQRSSPFLGRAAQALGLNGQQLDDLFRQAAQITP